MSIETIPVHTWQFYLAVKKVLGKVFMPTLFKVSPRQVDRWACDPDFSASSQRNPMDRYETLLSELMEVGKVRLARGAVDRQAMIVECRLVCDGEATPDKDNLADELLDDLPAVTKLHTAIINREPAQIVRELLSEAKRELDEDYQAYLNHM